MDTTEENMTPKKMLERIAELDYSQSHLREQNAEMRHWLDVADDELAALRSENTSLRKQVHNLERIIIEAQQVEAEPCRSVLADDLDVKRYTEKNQRLEEETAVMKEQNKQLTAELKSLQEERDQDKISLNTFKDALQTLQWGIEDAQVRLQQKDDVIIQKSMLLEQSEETIQECSSFMKDLRLTNRELRQQLEDRQDEASFAVLNDVAKEKEGPISPPLSFAEEIKQLASSTEAKSILSDSTDPRHEDTDAEETPQPQTLHIDIQTQRCAGILLTAVQSARLVSLFVFILTVLAFVGSGSCAGICFSITPLWNSLLLMLYPFCSVQYNTLPPI